jgi:hypothetical protein
LKFSLAFTRGIRRQEREGGDGVEVNLIHHTTNRGAKITDYEINK